MSYIKLTFVLKKYLWLIALLIVVVPVITSGIQESKSQDDWSILFTKLGNGLVTVDNSMYEKIADKNYNFEKMDDTTEKIDESFKFFKDLFLDLWKYIFVYFAVFYALFRFFIHLNNDNRFSKPIKAFFWTSIMTSILFIIGKGVPFKGLFYMIKTIWQFFGSF